MALNKMHLFHIFSHWFSLFKMMQKISGSVVRIDPAVMFMRLFGEVSRVLVSACKNSKSELLKCLS